MTRNETTPKIHRIWPAILLVGSLGIGANATAVAVRAQDSSSANQNSPGERTDGQIEMDVVHALDAAPTLKQDWITAGTVQGEVTLSGTSASEANRQLAASIAGKVPGVAKVINNLKVGDPQTAQDNQPPDYGDYPDQGQPPANNDNGYNNGQQQSMAPIPPPQQAPAPGYPQYNAPREGPQAPEPPHSPVTVAAGAVFRVRSSMPLDSKKAVVGTPVEFTLVADVYSGGVLAVPRGATIRGEVTDVKSPGALSGSPELALKIDALQLGGMTYPLDATPYQVKGPSKTGHTVGNVVGGALFGALVGGAIGGGGGAAIGAAAGGAGGTAASAATPGPRIWIPAEALLDFHLNSELIVVPVSSREVRRLAANAPPPSQRPILYRRAYYPYYPYPYGYPPPPPPPPPGYYYRPY